MSFTSYAHLPAIKWARGTELKQVRVTAVIPAFAYANGVPGTATKMSDYAIGNLTQITIGRPIDEDIGDNGTFIIAVRCLNDNGDTIRFVIYRPDDLDLTFHWPDYAGQTLNSPAVLEIWANNEYAVIYSNEDIPLVVNTVTMYDSGDSCFCEELTGDTLTLTAVDNVNITVPPGTPVVVVQVDCGGLIEWSAGYPHPAFQFKSSTYDPSTHVRQTAIIKWPDKVMGTWTATVINTAYNDVDAWIATYAATGATVVQPVGSVRDIWGMITSKPDLVCTGPAGSTPSANTIAMIVVFADVSEVQVAIVTSPEITVRDAGNGLPAKYYLDASSIAPDDNGDTTIVDAAGTHYTRLPGIV